MSFLELMIYLLGNGKEPVNGYGEEISGSLIREINHSYPFVNRRDVNLPVYLLANGFCDF